MSIAIDRDEMLCPGCGGDTSWICPYCHGNGCSECRSDGTTTCTVCEGSGKLAWRDAQWMLRALGTDDLCRARYYGKSMEQADTHEALAEDAADAAKEERRQ